MLLNNEATLTILKGKVVMTLPFLCKLDLGREKLHDVVSFRRRRNPFDSYWDASCLGMTESCILKPETRNTEILI